MSWLNRHERITLYHCGWRVTRHYTGQWRSDGGIKGTLTSRCRDDLFRRIEAIDELFRTQAGGAQ